MTVQLANLPGFTKQQVLRKRHCGKPEDSDKKKSDEDRKGKLSSLLSPLIFFQLLSFDSQLYTDLTIL